jgi:hypothetical protein
MHIWIEIQSLSLDYVFYNISIAVQVAQTLSDFTMCISLLVVFVHPIVASEGSSCLVSGMREVHLYVPTS